MPKYVASTLDSYSYSDEDEDEDEVASGAIDPDREYTEALGTLVASEDELRAILE